MSKARFAKYDAKPYATYMRYLQHLYFEARNLPPLKKVVVKLVKTDDTQGQSKEVQLGDIHQVDVHGSLQFGVAGSSALYSDNLAVCIADVDTGEVLAVRPTMVVGLPEIFWRLTNPFWKRNPRIPQPE